MSVPKKETAEHRQERLRKDRVRVRKWRAANREKSRTNTARWYLENREGAGLPRQTLLWIRRIHAGATPLGVSGSVRLHHREAAC